MPGVPHWVHRSNVELRQSVRRSHLPPYQDSMAQVVATPPGSTPRNWCSRSELLHLGWFLLHCSNIARA